MWKICVSLLEIFSKISISRICIQDLFCKDKSWIWTSSCWDKGLSLWREIQQICSILTCVCECKLCLVCVCIMFICECVWYIVYIVYVSIHVHVCMQVYRNTYIEVWANLDYKTAALWRHISSVQYLIFEEYLAKNLLLILLSPTLILAKASSLEILVIKCPVLFCFLV